ncbi:MAG: translation elongation factor Ts [Candidatus Firestonebacteria bacterium RIFOXYC2_FULL_39_67]|nr:MAG: translation elongation factor Ts [Candidatus Firestonebacteria bacterium RIFOXYD2_FULL_39_29]OGF55229.1 MAG: translation elongation factor Ts [Candidatus Firestonebacteria bacterium RifOxyC12_full_39_7]OGF57600.1 MAG: translation elongation factor Ts [Candidatus Firestonebacteria bacterium RIFOXYC2_FULL_39_67]
MISAKVVAELREKTGAGMMSCKEALESANGDMEKAVEYLRKKGMASAQKRAAKSVKAGVVYAYLHMEGTVGAMVEVNCETDFVAKTDDFKELAKDVAMQVAAMNPIYVKREDVPAELLEKERAIYREEVAKAGKPANIIEKIVEGKLEKFYKDFCLVDQTFIKDDKMQVKDLVAQKISKIGENISIKRFARFKIGE